MRPEPSEIAGSARWHLHDYDDAAETASLLRLDESHFRQASFLDQRVEAPARDKAVVPLDKFAEAVAGAPPAEAPRYIFHIGHCGSTLVSRALDASPATLPLREPLTLRRLARRTDAPGSDRTEILVQAHRRVFRPGQSAVIKATSTCNALIRPLLEPHPTSRALLVYVDLETYLAGMLGRQTPALDLRGHLPARLEDWGRMADAPPLEAESLDEPRLAALAWLTGMRHLAVAAQALAQQVRLLNFETFLAAPEGQLMALAEWLGYGADGPALLAAWPEVANGYSKQPEQPYSAFNRRRTQARGRTHRGGEIEMAFRWAEALAETVAELRPCAPFLREPPPGD